MKNSYWCIQLFLSAALWGFPVIAVAQNPYDVVASNLEFKTVLLLPTGTPDRYGPEFVVQFSKMHRGDFTYRQNGVSGRAVDCAWLAARENDRAFEYVLTAKFIDFVADPNIAMRRNVYSPQNEGGPIVTDINILDSYFTRLSKYRSRNEILAVAQFCQDNFPP